MDTCGDPLDRKVWQWSWKSPQQLAIRVQKNTQIYNGIVIWLLQKTVMWISSRDTYIFRNNSEAFVNKCSWPWIVEISFVNLYKQWYHYSTYHKSIKQLTYWQTYHSWPALLRSRRRLGVVMEWKEAFFALRKNVSGIHILSQLWSSSLIVCLVLLLNGANDNLGSVHCWRTYIVIEKSWKLWKSSEKYGKFTDAYTRHSASMS